MLSPDEQAGYIAEYDTAMTLEYLEARAQQRDAEAKARRNALHGKSRA